MIAKRVTQTLSLALMTFAFALAAAQSAPGNDELEGGGCIDEGRTRGRIMGDRAAPVYPFAVGSRSIE